MVLSLCVANLWGKAKDVEGILSVEKLLIVINGVDLGLSLGDIDVVVDVLGQTTLGLETSIDDTVSERLQQLVEDVVRSLDSLLLRNARLLEEIRHDVAASQLSRRREEDSDELAKARRIVVPRGLCVAVRLEDGVRRHDLVLEGNLLLSFLAARPGGDHGQVADHLLGVLSFSGSRLASDEHGVVFLVCQHVPVGSLSDGPEVGRHLFGYNYFSAV